MKLAFGLVGLCLAETLTSEVKVVLYTVCFQMLVTILRLKKKCLPKHLIFNVVENIASGFD